MHARLTFSSCSALLAGLFALAAFSSPILAQNERGQLETIGRVMGLQGNMMQVETNDGVVWVVQLPNRNERVTYRNTAGQKFLSPGLYVSLTGKFDKRGKMEGVATDLRVFTPESPDQLGVFPDALSSGLNPPQGQPDETDVPKSYQVSGRIAKVSRNGDLMLQAGAASVTIPVDPQVKVDVEVGSLELVRPGDTVNLDAWYYPQRVGQAMATRIEVIGAQPLGVEPVAGAPAPGPKTPEKPAFTPGLPPNQPKPASTILPNTPQPGAAPKPGSTILPNPPQPGTPKPGADPFDLK